MQDLIIIGGGPAGLSAALTARNRNKSVLVITGSMADSGLWKAGRITNYPGTPDIPGKRAIGANDAAGEGYGRCLPPCAGTERHADG